MTFAPTAVTGWQQTVLHEAVSLIGYPYVWAGTSEKPQAPLGTTVPGGFDCSGFVWRIYKLAPYAPGGGRNPAFQHPLVCPSLLAPLEPNTDVAGLPAWRPEGDEPWLYDGRATIRLRSRSGRRRA